MSIQLPLSPELAPMPLPAKYYRWFKIANAHPSNDWKKRWFYPFKDKFMRRYASMDHYDLQIIEKECWGEDGQGGCLGCSRCEDGIYSSRQIVLERWQFPNGDLYHRPSNWFSRCDGYRNTIKGYIKHSDVSERQAELALLRLSLRYDRCLFYDLAKLKLTSPFSDRLTRLHWKIFNCRVKIMNFFCEKTGSNETPF